MKQVKIRLNTIPQVQNFVNTIYRFTSETDLSSGKYIVDAKSIMGIFSLNLMQPVTLTVNGEDEDEVIEAVKDLIVEE
ncbi:MAG: HPr family phosphocarrier protein [Clostridia bacterium]|nr:HPr family phosphocarrier protein [Clostridia bacterium]